MASIALQIFIVISLLFYRYFTIILLSHRLTLGGAMDSGGNLLVPIAARWLA